MSAAAGKLGAIIGIQVVSPFFDSYASIVMCVFAIVMFTGFVATYLIPEPRGKSLEELSGGAMEGSVRGNYEEIRRHYEMTM